MRLLLDSCIAPGTADILRQAGHDVEWVGEWQEDPGDEEILAQALVATRVLVTLDKDFGELAVVFGRPHCGILRIVNHRASQQASVTQQIIKLHGQELESGALITAEPGKVRIRPADPTDS